MTSAPASISWGGSFSFNIISPANAREIDWFQPDFEMSPPDIRKAQVSCSDSDCKTLQFLLVNGEIGDSNTRFDLQVAVQEELERFSEVWRCRDRLSLSHVSFL